MKLVVSTVLAAPKTYAVKVLAGIALLVVCDAAWLRAMRTLYEPLTALATRKKAVAGVAAYAVVAALVAASVEADSYSHAAAAGALLGFLVFFTYNVTTAVVMPNWVGWGPVVDVAYGTSIWALLLVVMHAVERGIAPQG